MNQKNPSTLVNELVCENETVRLFAVLEIGGQHATWSAGILALRLAEERSRAVKEAIVQTLQLIDSSNAWGQIFPLFGSSDAFLRDAAVSIFGAGGDEAVSFLAPMLAVSDPAPQKLIMDSLFDIGTPKAAGILRNCLHDPDLDVQITSVEYLGRLKDRACISDLFEMLFSEIDPILKTLILEALVYISDPEPFDQLFEQQLSLKNETELTPLFIPILMKMANETGNAARFQALIQKLGKTASFSSDMHKAFTRLTKKYRKNLSQAKPRSFLSNTDNRLSP